MDIRPIPSYPGYFADSDGNIWSERWGKRKKLKPHDNGRGRFGINICYNQKRTYIKVHRLVAEAFHGFAGDEVHHIDGDPSNNKPDNLNPLSKEDHINMHHNKEERIRKAIRLLQSEGYTIIEDERW